MRAKIGNRFEIIDEIHHGQMANSYRAKDLESGSTVFLKILHPALKSDEDILMRFHREVKLAGSIEHPNVVNLVESGEIEGSLYISFEWQDGELLSSFFAGISEGCGITLNETACCIAQILAGLQAIHDAGIVHRDLKPGNILLDKEGKIHILDFSLSLSSKDSRITAHGNIVGTPGYLAPEVIAGGNPSPQSDLFAVGIIFYELLSGEPLFSSDDIYSTLQKVHEADIVSLTEIREDVPREVDDFIKKLLAKHPDDRFPDARTALERLKSIESLNIREDSPVMKRIPGKRKLSKYIYTSALIIFLVLASVVTLNINSNHVEETEPEQIASADTANIADTSSGQTTSVDSTVIREPETEEPEIKAVSKKEKSTTEVKHDDESKITAPPAQSSEQKVDTSSISNTESVEMAELKKDSVFVDISVFPWAKVYIEGKFLGTTPLLSGTKCLPGEHLVRFEHPEFPVVTKLIDFGDKAEFSININMENEFGRLDFEIIPWGYIIIDDMNEGTAPLPKPLFVAPGEHVVKIQHPNFMEVVRQIDIKAGEMIIVNVNFTEEQEK